MTGALLLAGYALLLAIGVPKLLVHGTWSSRAPRLAIAAWLSATVALFSTLMFTALSLAIPGVHVSTNLELMLQACWAALRASYATAVGAALGGIGLTLGVGVLLRVSFCVIRAVRHTHREANGYASALGLLGQMDADLGAMVVAHEVPAAFCLPGRRGTVVISSGALSTLTKPELAAVLAHERAHQQGHHHVLLAVVEGFAASFGRVPLLRHSAEQVRYLIELLADDAATRRGDRLTLAEALVSFAASGIVPSGGALAVASGALPRMRRLLAPRTQLSTTQRMAAVSVTVLLLATPLLMILLPALTSHMVLCPDRMPLSAALACLR
jgi:Zn-dependent protease with chaperone function